MSNKTIKQNLCLYLKSLFNYISKYNPNVSAQYFMHMLNSLFVPFVCTLNSEKCFCPLLKLFFWQWALNMQPTFNRQLANFCSISRRGSIFPVWHYCQEVYLTLSIFVVLSTADNALCFTSILKNTVSTQSVKWVKFDGLFYDFIIFL